MHFAAILTAVAAFAATLALASPEEMKHKHHHTTEVDADFRSTSTFIVVKTKTSYHWTPPPTETPKHSADDNDLAVVYNYESWHNKTMPTECTTKWLKSQKKHHRTVQRHPFYCQDRNTALGHRIAEEAGCLPYFEPAGCKAIAEADHQKNEKKGCPGYFWFHNPEWKVPKHKKDGCPVPMLPECKVKIGKDVPGYCGLKYWEQLMAHEMAK